MTVFTETRHAGEFLLNEGPGSYSRENITILSGEGVLPAGRVIGLVAANDGAVTVGAPATVGTGAGVLTKANPAYGAGVQEGTYKVEFIETTSAGGAFQVIRPDGTVDGIGTVGVAYDGQVKFTVADGTPDFLAGDVITLAVAIAELAGAGKYRSADPTNADGSGVGSAILLYPIDATSADVETVAIVRQAEVNGNIISYDAAVDDTPKTATKNAELKAAGIIVR